MNTKNDLLAYKKMLSLANGQSITIAGRASRDRINDLKALRKIWKKRKSFPCREYSITYINEMIKTIDLEINLILKHHQKVK